jgi:hypothetical protein
MQSRQPRQLGAVVTASLAFMAACDCTMPTDPSPAFLPSAAILASTSTVEVQNFKVCKVGTDADFTFTVNGGAATAFSLDDGECSSIHQYAGWPPDQVSVTETAQANVQLDSIVLTRELGGGPISVTSTTLLNTYTASGQIEFEEGYVATFYNTPILPPPPGGEGCTPGYWKNHLSAWPVSAALDFDATFGVDLFNPDVTLGQAVRLGGGGKYRLARHGTAAYLNSFAINSPYTTAQVIAYVQADDADALEYGNELGCPLN